MRTWGVLLIVAGVLLVAPLGLFAWAHFFYAVGVDGPGLIILPVAGAASLFAGAVVMLRARRATSDQSDKAG